MYSVAVFILFQLNNCVRSEKLFLVKQNPTSASLNYLQVLKCILMNSGDENMMKYPVASYLLHDSTGHFYIRNLYNNPKRTLPPLMKNSLQRLLRLPPKNCLTLPTTVGEVTSRNIEIATTANPDRETFDYNTKIQFPAKQNDSIIESNVMSKNGKILDHDETSSEAAWVNTTEFKVKEITNNLYSFFDQYKQSLVQFNRIFYKISATKLMFSQKEKENGISFVQSGLLLYMALLSLSTEVDLETKKEIDTCLMNASSHMKKITDFQHIAAWLPQPNNDLKFRWAVRLVLEERLEMSQQFLGGIKNGTKIVIEHFNSTASRDNVYDTLNRMVEIDSGGAMRDTFIEDDFLDGFCSILITTMYIRSRWRSAPTVLNGTYPFKDGSTREKSVNMIKLNDIMGYGDLKECDAEMNITRLVDAKPSPDNKCGELKLSHAVQRLMFWAEAGSNAFKDDGIEWDEKPELELLADRPYLFYVRWKNVTLMNGNFVL
ncbi:uncharacterized protein LOC116769389 isoform X2 [Danaus plexippus]|uniref:uncharacterized protein LOC116769389 isoform X2 n=1 Tax=Danaus plexippus TaxID=13037 RepID=UPI002AB233D8|nr:uncharacterized protein LOC116769389 isoform X2 [Danaus plexippus]